MLPGLFVMFPVQSVMCFMCVCVHVVKLVCHVYVLLCFLLYFESLVFPWSVCLGQVLLFGLHVLED